MHGKFGNIALRKRPQKDSAAERVKTGIRYASIPIINCLSMSGCLLHLRLKFFICTYNGYSGKYLTWLF